MLRFSCPNPCSTTLRKNASPCCRYVHIPKYSSNERQDLHWPNHFHPTPYEIFGIPSGKSYSNINQRALKKKYYEYVKLYHPDMAPNMKVLKHRIGDKAVLLNSQEKAERFRLVSEAYNILRSSQKKQLYDLTKSSWNAQEMSNFHNTAKSRFETGQDQWSNYEYQYWNAGTWEDVNGLHDRLDTKLDPWTVFMWVCGMAMSFQAISLLSRLGHFLTDDELTHEEIEANLLLTYNNYGFADDKLSRLKRFLWFRTYGMYRSKEDLDREAKSNKSLIDSLRSR